MVSRMNLIHQTPEMPKDILVLPVRFGELVARFLDYIASFLMNHTPVRRFLSPCGNSLNIAEQILPDL